MEEGYPQVFLRWIGHLTEADCTQWVRETLPYFLFSILVAYLVFVKITGISYMKDRPPYQLKKTIILYNLFQVFYNGFLVYSFVVPMNGLVFHYEEGCWPKDSETNFIRPYMNGWAFLFAWSKVVDLLDTVFFVLRKKNGQITFLHLIHHVFMVILCFYTFAYHMDELLIIYACMNSFVHTIMYFYYFLAALGPAIQKYLWWKSHLTKVQIIQFVILLTHMFYMKIRGCRVSTFITITWTVFTALIMILFLNFYFKTYDRKKEKRMSLSEATRRMSDISQEFVASQ